MNLQTNHKIYTSQDFFSVKTMHYWCLANAKETKKSIFNLQCISLLQPMHLTSRNLTLFFLTTHKVGVDCVDMMLKKYSTKRPLRIWPVAVFCNILDVSAVNLWIIYKKVIGNAILRRDFIIKLAEKLAAVGPIFDTLGPETPTSSQLSDIVSPVEEVCVTTRSRSKFYLLLRNTGIWQRTWTRAE